MNRAEERLAAELAADYKQFLEKKGYVFKLALDRRHAGGSPEIEYFRSLEKHTVRVPRPSSVLHEITHIVLDIDGVTSATHKVRPNRELSELQKQTYPNAVVSILPDYYVRVLMYRFCKELGNTRLKQGFIDYFKIDAANADKLFNERLPRGVREVALQQGAQDNLQLHRFDIGSYIFFKYCGYTERGVRPEPSFYSFLKKVAELNPGASAFLNGRLKLITNFVDTLPTYDKLKKECADAGCPQPTAKLSIRLFNIFYFGVDMEDRVDMTEFERLVQEDKISMLRKLLQDYGVGINESELKEAHKIVDKMIAKDYQAFIPKCTREETKFSLLLV